MIELATLGGASIRRDGSEFTGLSAQKQKVALISYLAIEGPVARDNLLGLFWPQKPEEKARHSLSQILYAVRKELGEECVSVAGDQVGLVWDDLVADVKQMEAAAQAERWEDVVELYRGPFLDQFHLPESLGFDEWQTRTRAWVSALARKAFSKVIASRYAAGDVGGALEIGNRWARLEPLEDEAQHALIALLALAGDRTAALVQYEAYRRRLKEELEVEPLEATVAMVEYIRAGVMPESPLLQDALAAAPRPAVPAPDTAAPVAITGADLDRILQDELAPDLEIVRKLGESSAASVYLAREPKFKRRVAVKVFSPKLARNRRARLRFEREVQAIGSLTHPNIVGLHWAGALSNGLPYFVMEYVAGTSMADKLKAEGTLTVSEARRALAGVAWALAAAHRRGIVHRDVQPANVLHQEETGRALLADFGIAGMLAATEERPVRLTESGELVGDPAWMSPEQLMGEPATERSDVYGLGLLGFELLAGRGPFDAESRRELYAAHVRERPRRLTELRPDVDRDLAELLERCLAKQPTHRPSAERAARVLSARPGEEPVVPEPHKAWPRRILSALAERRVPHALAAYLAGGFVLVELVGEMVSRELVADVFSELSLLTYALGAPAVGIVTWFHGRRGRQKFERLEYCLLGALATLWLALSVSILLRS
jgi:DNA-binding SARP family transcriptional activator/tRNA A-37 threonylcarbamoyl transferase component Bud32